MAGEIYFKSGSKSSITTQAPLTPSYKAGTVYFAIDNDDNGFIYLDYNNKRIPMTAIANKDSANNTIISTYMASVDFNSNSSSLIFKDGNNDDHSTVLLPFLLLTGGNVTGPVNFGDSVTADELTAGSLIVNGIARFNNGLIGNLTGNADTATSATSATNDSENHKIVDYYIHSITTSNNTLTYKNGNNDSLGTANIINSVSNTWAGGTTSGPTIKTTINGVSGNAVTIPSASASTSGVVTTGTQTFAGSKTFSSKIIGNLQGNADTATKATNDGGGNEIESTYIKTISYSGNSTTNAAGSSITAGSAGLVTMTKGDDTTNKIDIPAATASIAGLVNNGAQTFAGTKTFSTGLTISSGTSTKAMFNYSDIQAGTSDSARPVWFAWAGQNGTPVIDTDFTYNPSTNTLKAVNFDGLATKATGDSNGNNILSTYANSLTLSGNTLILKNKNGDKLSEVTITDSDIKVNVTLGTTSKAYILGTTTTPTGTATGVTSIADTGVYLGTTAGELVATKFTGNLAGNASTATSATNDSANHKITDHYVHSITTSSNTLTYKDGDGDQLGTANLVNSVSNTWAAGTTSGPTIKTTVNGVNGTAVAIPSASASNSGVVTTGNQTFAGTKTFNAKIVGNLQGNADTATKATNDASGNEIESTYIKTIAVTDSSTKIQLTKGDGTTSKINAEWLPLIGGTVTGTTQINRNIFTNTTSVPEQGETVLTALGFKTGYPVYTDPLFTSGNNYVDRYNNNHSSAPYTTVERITYTNAGITNPGTGSDYVIRIQNTGSGTSPGLGGFVQNISSRANAVFVQIFRALIPVGYTLYTASNSMGNSYSDIWLTDPKGTGKWEWYARRVICGKDGSFSSGGHVYLNGTAGTSSAPVKWYLSYCNLYDLTKAQYDGLRTRYADNADSATKATNDGGGNEIESTYIKSLSVSGTTLTIKKGDDTTSTITLQDNNTDTKVNVKARGTTKAYVLGTTTSPTSSNQAVESVAETGVYFDTTAAKLVATTFKGTLEGNASTATSATNDSANHKIVDHYIHSITSSNNTLTYKDGDDDQLGTATIINSVSNSWAAGTSAGPTLTTTINGKSGTAVAIPSASASASGVVTTGTQTFAGSKTFSSKIIGNLQGNADTATSATNDSGSHKIIDYYIHNITFDSSTSKLTYKTGNDDPTDILLPFLLLTGGNITGPVSFGDSVSIDALTVGSLVSTGVATFNNGLIGNLTGNADTATKATQDSNGNNILTTYANSLTASGTTLTLKNKNGDILSTVTTQDTNTKVNVTLGTTTKAYILATSTTPTSTATGVTSIADTGVYLGTTAGELVATKFTGALNGNAATATLATKATGDSNGNNILTTYASSLTVSGTTLTLKNKNGDILNSVTTQDTKNTAGSTQNANKLYLIGATSQAANPQTYSSSKVYVTDGTVTATTFSGNLSGNATTATSATKATYDSGNNEIESTYIKTLSYSDNNLTVTKGDGTTSTIVISHVAAQIIRW